MGMVCKRGSSFSFRPIRQRGVTIVVVLIMLVMMCLVGAVAAQISMLSSQATRYQRDYMVAYEAAQAGIIDAIMDIEAGSRHGIFSPGNDIMFVSGCGGSGNSLGLCAYDDASSSLSAAFTADFRGGSNTVSYGSFTGNSFMTGATGLKPVRPPRYIIEALNDYAGQTGQSAVTPGGKPEPYIYRITAMGFGPRDSVYSVIQADYYKGTISGGS